MSNFKFKADLEKLWGAVDKASRKVLVRQGAIVEREAKRLVSQGGGKAHVPSKPGKPPHVQTGVLRSSIAFAIDTAAFEPTVLVGPTAKYGKYLEFGTRKMAARPFMRPALTNTENQLLEAWKDQL